MLIINSEDLVVEENILFFLREKRDRHLLIAQLMNFEGLFYVHFVFIINRKLRKHMSI